MRFIFGSLADAQKIYPGAVLLKRTRSNDRPAIIINGKRTTLYEEYDEEDLKDAEIFDLAAITILGWIITAYFLAAIWRLAHASPF